MELQAASPTAQLPSLPAGLDGRLLVSGPAVDRLKNCPATEVIVTNTLPIDDARRFDKLTVLSIAPLLARVIQEVFEDGSVTSLFDGTS